MSAVQAAGPSAASTTADTIATGSSSSATTAALLQLVNGSTSSTRGFGAGSAAPPSNAVFDTQVTTAGRKFLTKVKKHRAMAVDRRARGFERGLAKGTVVRDAVTHHHYSVLLLDPDLQRREELADALEEYFEVLVAATIDRALALLPMVHVDLVLVRLAMGNNQTVATSAGLAAQRELLRYDCHLAIAFMVSSAEKAEKLLTQALARGGCGFFEDSVRPDVFVPRLTRLLHSLALAHGELVKTSNHTASRTRTEARTTTTNALYDEPAVVAPPRSGKPASLMVKRASLEQITQPLKFSSASAAELSSSYTYDREKMLLELGLKQRRQCHERRQRLTVVLNSSSQSVLGVELSRRDTFGNSSITIANGSNSVSEIHNGNDHREEGDDGGDEAPMLLARSSLMAHCQSAPTTLGPAPLDQSARTMRPSKSGASTRDGMDQGFNTRPRTVGGLQSPSPSPSPSPLPSPSLRLKPHTLQTTTQQRLYNAYHRESLRYAALPQDPLLRPCVAVDPASVSTSSAVSNLLVGRAFRLFQEQRLPEALAACDRALQRQDHNLVHLAYLLRGVLLDRMGQYAEAEAQFLIALRRQPALHQAHFNLSVCRLKLGRDAEALRDVTTALRMAPGHVDYLSNRALIYRRLGDFTLAQAEYTKLDALTTPATPDASHSNHHATVPHSIQGRRVAKGPPTGLEDGLFDHLFGGPTPTSLALVCAPVDRTPAMLALVATRLQNELFFHEFPNDLLTQVAAVLEYEVVACGSRFVLGEQEPGRFYFLLSGRLSVRRQFSELGAALATTAAAISSASVTTYHIEPGRAFGCTGHLIHAHTTLMADESCEVAILAPSSFTTLLQPHCTAQNNARFQFVRQLAAFQSFSASALGHAIAISERHRFRAGDCVLLQNEVPLALGVLWKGTCTMLQEFTRDDGSRSHDGDADDTEKDPAAAAKNQKTDERVVPYHHLLATRDWPLGFHVDIKRQKKPRKLMRGRRNAVSNRLGLPASNDHKRLLTELHDANNASQMTTASGGHVSSSLHEWASLEGAGGLPVKTLTPGALFGESALLDQKHSRAKCTIVANAVVEVLFFSHLRLQEMELEPETIQDLLRHAPEYMEEEQVARQRAEAESWSEYKSLRMLELSKTRWPNAHHRLRPLGNGCSVMLAADKPRRTSSHQSKSRSAGDGSPVSENTSSSRRQDRVLSLNMSELDAANDMAPAAVKAAPEEITWLHAHGYAPWGDHVAKEHEPLASTLMTDPHLLTPRTPSYSLSGAEAALLNDHIAVVVGGRYQPTAHLTSTGRLDLFDTNQRRWLSTVDIAGDTIPTRRLGHSVVGVQCDGDDTEKSTAGDSRDVVVFGGEPILPDEVVEPLNDCYKLTLTDNNRVLRCVVMIPPRSGADGDTSNAWPCARAWHGAASVQYAATADTKKSPGMLIMGGCAGDSAFLGDVWVLLLNPGVPEETATPQAEVVLGPTWVQLTSTGNSPLPLAGHRVVAIENGEQVVVIGGRQTPRSLLHGIFILTMATLTWSQPQLEAPATRSLARCGHTALAMHIPIDATTGTVRPPSTKMSTQNNNNNNNMPTCEPLDPPDPEEETHQKHEDTPTPPLQIIVFGGFVEFEPSEPPSRLVLVDCVTPASATVRALVAPHLGLSSFMTHASVVTADAKSMFVFGGMDPVTRARVDTTSAVHWWEPPSSRCGVGGADAEEEEERAAAMSNQTHTYENGDVYTGSMTETASLSGVVLQRHGRGKCVYANGDEYDGEWRDDQRCGQGVLREASGATYAGQWLDDMRHGYGILEAAATASGLVPHKEKTYEGQWQQDQRHGSGAVQYTDGSSLMAQWHEGRVCGSDGSSTSCTLVGYDDGNGVCEYVGELQDGLPHGHGESRNKNETYSGQWHLGRRSGRGTTTLKDGTTYTGDWRNGKRNGFGVCQYARSRDRYEGKWVGGVRCGRGVCQFANGCLYDGDWRDDKCHGIGRYKLPDGTCYDGKWRANQFCGDGAFMLPANQDVAL